MHKTKGKNTMAYGTMERVLQCRPPLFMLLRSEEKERYLLDLACRDLSEKHFCEVVRVKPRAGEV